MSIAVILGSAFHTPVLGGRELTPRTLRTPFGEAKLHRYPGGGEDAFVLFRHGIPHRYLPNQIPYRAHTAALRTVGCRALLVTSSVGILDPALPLFEPLLVGDLLMPDNRLPDGSACTLFPAPAEGQGHLVLEEGLFSKGLSDQVEAIGGEHGVALRERVLFAYVGGPRTKTSAENAYWRSTGAQTNSMSLGPEVVLANEAEIPTAGLVVGHKYSVPRDRTCHDDGSPATPPDGNPLTRENLAESLDRANASVEALVVAFLEQGRPVPFRNRIYRF